MIKNWLYGNIAKGCTLDEANCFADETIREIENAKDYEHTKMNDWET